MASPKTRKNVRKLVFFTSASLWCYIGWLGLKAVVEMRGGTLG